MLNVCDADSDIQDSSCISDRQMQPILAVLAVMLQIVASVRNYTIHRLLPQRPKAKYQAGKLAKISRHAMDSVAADSVIVVLFLVVAISLIIVMVVCFVDG